MKIAHIVFGMLTGGIETMLINIANRQSTHPGDEISVFIINNIINENLISTFNSNIKVIRINREPGSKNPYYLLKLNILLLKFNPDTIHIHKANIYNYLSRYFKSRICLTQHENIKAEDTNPAKKIKKIFSISDSVFESLKAHTGRDSQIIYNGIDTKAFTVKHTAYKPGDQLNCISVGRLEHNIKGQHILIKAFSILKQQGITNIHIDFIGDGKSRDNLENMVNTMQLNNEITFLGDRSQTYISKNLHKYDLFILPSLSEGFGLSVIEAMIAGVPVLVSDIPGPNDIIENGKLGYNFKAGDPNDCAKKIKSIFHNGIPIEMIKAAQEKAYKYDISHTVKKYRESYETACSYCK